MSTPIGFDRPLELNWLDFVASCFATSGDISTAFAETRNLVAATTGGGASPHNATGKSMTVLARVWLKVPPAVAPVRDRAAAALAHLEALDRMAVHWAMCELAYPFFLDAARTTGRALDLADAVTLAGMRARLAERWGARGTMPAASQRLLQTWSRWGVLAETAVRGTYSPVARRPVGEEAATHVSTIRVLAEPNQAFDLDDLQRSSDLFPFSLPDVRESLRTMDAIQVNREGGSRWVARARA
jgi:hypothetical protein